MARASITYYDKKLGVDNQSNETLLIPVNDQVGVVWGGAFRSPSNRLRYSTYPPQNASFKPVPPQINTPEKLAQLRRVTTDYLVQNSRLRILSHKEMNLTQRSDEDERSFKIRLRDAARELRDAEVKKIQDDYEDKIDKIETKIRGFERGLKSDKDEVEARKREEYIGVGETLLGFFVGRKRTTGITTASRRRRMTEKAENDVEEKTGKIEDLKKDIEELEADLQHATDKITSKWDDVENRISVIDVKPGRDDVKIEELAIAWSAGAVMD
jgi:hypothetical protein